MTLKEIQKSYNKKVGKIIFKAIEDNNIKLIRVDNDGDVKFSVEGNEMLLFKSGSICWEVFHLYGWEQTNKEKAIIASLRERIHDHTLEEMEIAEAEKHLEELKAKLAARKAAEAEEATAEPEAIEEQEVEPLPF